jgi:hypothetical protein
LNLPESLVSTGAMALFSLLRSRIVNDPILGGFARSRGYWRGRVTLGAHRDVPLLIAGGRIGPDVAALALARQLPAHYPTLQGAIGTELFEHDGPYRDAFDRGEIDERIPHIADAAEVWPLVTPVQVIAAPRQGRPSIEIGYASLWDVEHTLAATVVDWRLVEFNGSIPCHR